MPGALLNALSLGFYLILTEIPRKRYFYCSHCKDEETDVMGP